jgi:hypothetical protein
LIKRGRGGGGLLHGGQQEAAEEELFTFEKRMRGLAVE